MRKHLILGIMTMFFVIGNINVRADVHTDRDLAIVVDEMVTQEMIDLYQIVIEKHEISAESFSFDAPITLLKSKDYGVIEYFTEYLHRQKFYSYNESINIPGSSQLKYNYRENHSSQIQILKNKKVHLKC